MERSFWMKKRGIMDNFALSRALVHDTEANATFALHAYESVPRHTVLAPVVPYHLGLEGRMFPLSPWRWRREADQMANGMKRDPAWCIRVQYGMAEELPIFYPALYSGGTSCRWLRAWAWGFRSRPGQSGCGCGLADGEISDRLVGRSCHISGQGSISVRIDAERTIRAALNNIHTCDCDSTVVWLSHIAAPLGT